MPAPNRRFWGANMPLPEDFRITMGFAVLGALLLAIGIWWLWWRLPKREVARLALKIRDPKARADIEDSYRRPSDRRSVVLRSCLAPARRICNFRNSSGPLMIS
jgi:hypothetical protein